MFGKRTPVITVGFTLAGRGYAIVQPADAWPPKTERASVCRLAEVAGTLPPSKLPADHLEETQAFFRLVACRYIPGEILKKWQLRIPAAVRAWLGLPPIPSSSRGDPSCADEGSTKGDTEGQGKRALGGVIAIGTYGALELWSESALSLALPEQTKDFDALVTKISRHLAHAGGGDQSSFDV